MTPNSLSPLWASGARDLCNHLWQSTLFAGVVALLALALRKYPARARHWLWMAASAKFLIPFSLLIAVGSQLARPTHPTQSQTTTYLAIDEMSQPFTADGALAAPIPVAASPSRSPIATLPIVLTTAWLCGFLTVLASWLVQWRRVARSMREATPLREGRVLESLRRIEQLARVSRPIPVFSSPHSMEPSTMEPGIFGILRPVLLWPADLSVHLDDAHLEAVLAHEACHVRRRDNLTSLLHMLVEAVFWFHPLVWWMESQLVKERECACDEEVLLLCHQPQVYAESILKVCELCLESPLTCVSGITGADLKQRIAQIMTATIARKLGPGAKLLLLAVGLLVAAVPVLAGRGRAMRSLSSLSVAAPPVLLPEKPSVDGAEVLSPSATSGMLSAPLAFAAQVSSPPAIPAATKLPEFEVATIKPNDPSKHPGALAWTQTSRNELKMVGSLKTFLKTAYGIEDIQIAGGPKWLDSELFDIDAKPPSPFASPAEMKLMLRALLAQRFKLSTHTDTNALPVYSLIVAKTGAKLQPANAFSASGYGNGPTMVRGTLDTAQLAHLLTPVLGRTVIDNTGLHGNYKIDLTWAADDQPSGPSLFTAIQEQLGLKLEPTKGPVEVLVIDHAEQPSMDGAELSSPAPASLAPVAMQMQSPDKPPAAGAPAKFEVVSLKPSAPNVGHHMGVQLFPDRIVMNYDSLATLICVAYNIPYWELSGGEGWMLRDPTDPKDHFDLEAKLPQDLGPYDMKHANFEIGDKRIREMMQDMLADRFHLKFHVETVSGTVSVLEQSGKPLQLVPSKLKYAEMYGDGYSEIGGAVEGKGVGVYNASMPQLARFLSETLLHHPVIDKTGLDGRYDFRSATIVTKEDFESGNVMNLYLPAVKEMGLKLTQATGPVEKFVIDHAEHPSGN